MNKLKGELTTLKNKLQEIESCLILSNERNDKVVRNQEQVEHRLHNLEELHEDLRKTVKMLHEDVGLVGEYLNTVITRVNDLHRCLNEWGDKVSRCDDDDDNDDDDDEFDLSDYDEKIDIEVARMRDNDCLNK